MNVGEGREKEMDINMFTSPPRSTLCESNTSLHPDRPYRQTIDEDQGNVRQGQTTCPLTSLHPLSLFLHHPDEGTENEKLIEKRR